MNTHADKTQEKTSQSAANAGSQKQGSEESLFQFVDNRPEAVTQRKLQEMANSSPQVSQLKAFQEMANSSPRAKQATQLQKMADNYTAQQQQPIQKKENNTGLPDNLKSGIEKLSGYSMDDVKVHRNSDKPAQLQAHAYAQGTDIHLGPGQEKHLPHEAWHVVQQKQGRVRPDFQSNEIAINSNPALEKDLNPGILPVQRLKIDENPVVATRPGISKSTHLKGGNKGEIFILERAAEKLVAKFQNEEPIEALMGTEIMKAVGAESPSVREATNEDIRNIGSGINQGLLTKDLSYEQKKDFIKEKNAKKYFLLMEYASGSTIKAVKNDSPLQLIKVLEQPSFREGLGKIIAADVFAGNPDRMFARWTLGGVVGWYHEENLFIDISDVDNAKAVAIDNAFNPRVTKAIRASKPFGLHIGGTGVQFGSVAAAHKDTLSMEAGLIYDFILQSIQWIHPDNSDVTEAIKEAEGKRGAFAAAIAQAGTEAMTLLLKDAEKWLTSEHLPEDPESKMKIYFAERIAYLRAIQKSNGEVGNFARLAEETIKTR
jgi:hypothetical protein